MVTTSSVPHASPKEHDITGTAHGNTCFSIRQPSCIILKANSASICDLCLKICCFISCSRDAHISSQQAWSKSVSTGRATCTGIRHPKFRILPIAMALHFHFGMIMHWYYRTLRYTAVSYQISNQMLQSLFDLRFRCSWRPPSWAKGPKAGNKQPHDVSSLQSRHEWPMVSTLQCCGCRHQRSGFTIELVKWMAFSGENGIQQEVLETIQILFGRVESCRVLISFCFREHPNA